MKKSLRTLVVLSIAASSILFATPSQAAVIGGVTITTTGNITGTSLSGNLFYYTSNSVNTNPHRSLYWFDGKKAVDEIK